jgi:hypothetical protein
LITGRGGGRATGYPLVHKVSSIKEKTADRRTYTGDDDVQCLVTSKRLEEAK